MAFFVENWSLILLALVSGGMLAWPWISGGGAGGISPAEAVQSMNREKAVVIDVCEPGEFAAGHIGGARNIPAGQFGAVGTEKLKGLPGNKALPVIVVCASGLRARRAAQALKRAGWANAKVLNGGLRAWRDAGLPVQSGPR